MSSSFSFITSLIDEGKRDCAGSSSGSLRNGMIGLSRIRDVITIRSVSELLPAYGFR